MKKLPIHSTGLRIKAIINGWIVKLTHLYKDMPITIKLMLILNVVILIPLITISYVSYHNCENILKNKSVQYSQDILKIVNLRLDDYISSLDSISMDLLNNSTVDNYIQDGKSPVDPVQIYHDQQDVRSVLKDEIGVKNEAQSISIFVGDTLNCFADDNMQRESIEDILPYGSKLYDSILEETKESGGSPIWYFDSSDGKVTHIFYARAIIDLDTYQDNGMLVLMVNTDWFDTVFNGIVNEDMEKAAVISQNKEVILSKADAQNYPLSDSLFKSMSSDRGWLVDKSQNTLISYVTAGNEKWKILSYIPLSTLYRDVETIKQKIIVALFAAVIFLLLVSFCMSYDFIFSINILVSGMEKVQKGEEDVQVKLDRKDELGFLGQAFNTMVREIKTLQKWVIREQLTRKDAQIKALQSQINPHFLFNTLESINWMAQLNGVPEISETVTALASLMDASIARDDKCITLEEEIGYIDNYILILKKRFEDKLELVKEVESKALAVRVPRLLIQPLVENAANHGIVNVRGKGIVKLSAVVSGDLINITVEDNGAGIDTEDIEIINERLAMDDETYFKYQENRKSRGIGLENVNRRIKLFYGAQYGVKIDSVKGSYTKVSVQIPLEANERTRET
jgi:two-component system sensor histidine kinase YesM